MTTGTRIVTGDNIEVLRGLPARSVDLVVTSPPYNIGKEYETRRRLADYLEGFRPLLHELARVLKPSGSIAWQTGNYVQDGEVFPLDIYFYPLFKELGLQLRNRIVWHFGHGLHARTRFSGRYETILWFTMSERYVFNLDDVRVASKYPGKRNFKGPRRGELSGDPRGKNPEDVWEILHDDWDAGVWDIVNVKSNHVEKTGHPAQFPVELVERLVLALSPAGGVVLDPFGGVGSTLIGAEKNGRVGVSIEIDERYSEIARARLAALRDGTLVTRPMGRPIHVPGGEAAARVPAEWVGRGVY